jgi:hypothetical protein
VTRPTTGELVTRLVVELLDHYDDDRTTAGLLARVRELVDPGVEGPQERKQLVSKAPAAPSPVSDAPFHLLTAVEADARHYERALRRELDYTPLRRGGSWDNTVSALRALPALVLGVGEDHPLAEEVRTALSRHRHAVLLLTGHRERPLIVPDPCPECRCHSLRQRPSDGAVGCTTPSCRASWSQAELGWLGRLVTHTSSTPSPATA